MSHTRLLSIQEISEIFENAAVYGRTLTVEERDAVDPSIEHLRRLRADKEMMLKEPENPASDPASR